MATDLTTRILVKMSARCRIGWIDFQPGSWDWRVANARASRITARRHGVRLTLHQALYG